MKRIGYSEHDLTDNLIRFEGRHPWGHGVTATVIASEGEAAVFDTLMYPADSHRMAVSLHQRGLRPKILINSHHHFDHTAGNQFFPGRILAQQLCRKLMKAIIPEIRGWAKESWSDRFGAFDPTLPNESFVRRATARVGKMQLLAVHTPGHSPDSAVVVVKGARTILTGDAVMEFPLFVGGNSGDCLRSLRAIQKMEVDFMVQGHGGVVPSGKLRRDIDYVERCRVAVREAGSSPLRQKAVQARPLEEFVGEKHAKALPKIFRQVHLWNLQKISQELAPAKTKR
jgi:cyclase